MSDIWIISDTHFQHENILKYEGGRKDRFETVQYMDECLVDYWNETVKPGDKVFHLGDVFFGNKETFPTLWAKLNGKKHLIVGNHDDVKYLASGNFFEKAMLWRIFGDKLLTHVPVHPSTLGEGRFEKDGLRRINIHGHTHSNGSPEGPYKSACVEMIDYRPKNLESF